VLLKLKLTLMLTLTLMLMLALMLTLTLTLTLHLRRDQIPEGYYCLALPSNFLAPTQHQHRFQRRVYARSVKPSAV
jgi:hypothetical protein